MPKTFASSETPLHCLVLTAACMSLYTLSEGAAEHSLIGVPELGKTVRASTHRAFLNWWRF